MKALWNGVISLGELRVAVQLYSATQEQRLKFVQLHDKDQAPVKRPLFCSKENTAIAASETVRAVESDSGYVMFTSQELSNINTFDHKAIRITQFCEQGQIPLAYYEKPYYLAAGNGSEYLYALLRESLAGSGLYAIGRYVLHNNEHVGLIEAAGDMLLLYRLRYAAELVPRTDIPTPALPQVNPAEVTMMQDIMTRYSRPVHMGDYHHEYEEKLRLLCKRKSKGLPISRQQKGTIETTPHNEVTKILAGMLDQGNKKLQ